MVRFTFLQRDEIQASGTCEICSVWLDDPATNRSAAKGHDKQSKTSADTISLPLSTHHSSIVVARTCSGILCLLQSATRVVSVNVHDDRQRVL